MSHMQHAGYLVADSSELEYTYDLQLPPQNDPEYIRPKPHDDEVESFAVSRVLPDRIVLICSSDPFPRSLRHYTKASSSQTAA